MNFTKLRVWILISLAALAISLPTYAQVTVIFTRHAEKAATPAKDPPLTEAGKKRADLLASMLADSGVAAIYVTELQRTQQTAAPLAARVHIKPTVMPAKDTAALVKAIRARQSGVAVVVGHSNTLPDIISALGGPKVEISDPQYDNLFVLTVGPSQSSLLRLHYGDTAPVPSPANTMMK
jgi:broad specificity phosphatase PhoE